MAVLNSSKQSPDRALWAVLGLNVKHIFEERPVRLDPERRADCNSAQGCSRCEALEKGFTGHPWSVEGSDLTIDHCGHPSVKPADQQYQRVINGQDQEVKMLRQLHHQLACPQLRGQLADEHALREDAEARGWDSEVARHARVISSLQRHLDRLQREPDPAPQA